MKPKPYPILVEPTFRSHPWGAEGLSSLFALPESDLPPAEVLLMNPASIIQNGELAGQTMDNVAGLGMDFMGPRGGRRGFPLSIKVFATGKPLALQVHPSDTAVRQDSTLRTNHKAWFVLDATAGAKVHAELKVDYTRQQLLSRLGMDALMEIVNAYDLEAGDCYYIPSGRVHGIGPNARILSVEESHPTTYTVGPGDFYEFEESPLIGDTVAASLVNFADRSNPRIVRDNTPGESRNRKIPLISTNPAFSLEEVRLLAKMHHRTGNQRFHVLLPLDAAIEVAVPGSTVQVPQYCACFMPAKTGSYSTIPSEPTRVLRVC